MNSDYYRLQVELVAHNPTSAPSGIGRYLNELYQRLAAHISVRVVRPVDPPLAGRFASLHNLPLGLRDHRPGSIVHFTQILGCSQMLWHPVRPAIATVHDLGILVCKEDEAAFTRFDRRVLDVQLAGLKRMDRFMVHSEKTRDHLVSKLLIPADRISIVPSSVDSQHFHPIANARQILATQYNIVLDDTAVNLIYVGSEVPRKNLAVILQAMAILGAEGLKTRLVKVGGSGGMRWRRRFQEDVERLNLEETVIFAESVPESDLPVFYSAADLAVTSTVLEGGFAWVAMEAMACGIPVIASEAALIPPSAAKAAVVLPSNDPVCMAKAIKQVIGDPVLMRQMAAAARPAVMQFTWENEAAITVDIYRSCMRKGEMRSHEQ